MKFLGSEGSPWPEMLTTYLFVFSFISTVILFFVFQPKSILNLTEEAKRGQLFCVSFKARER